MDKEEAKFILQSFRPDGADASDPAFAEALAVAAADRELGDWLATERSSDAAFAAALGSVEIPEGLRESIFAVLAGEDAESYDEMDAAFVGALASVQPPAGLREEILTAMKMEQEGVVPIRPTAKQAPSRVRSWLRGASVAAALVLGAFVAVQVTSKPPELTGAVNAENVAQFTIETLGQLSFSLDEEDENPVALVDWLKGQKMPAPETLPVGLSQVTGVGCKVLNLNDTKAALICFELDSGQIVHMVTLDRADMEGVLPALSDAKGNCQGCEVSGWSRVAWSDEERAFILLGKMKPEELAEVF